MSWYADNIRRIAKQKENKPGLGAAASRLPLDGSSKPMSDVGQPLKDTVGPLHLEVFLNPVPVETIEANNGPYTVLEAENLKFTDKNGNVVDVPSITYTVNS